MSAAEARELRDARDRNGVLIGEAFMVRTHPQWLGVRKLVEAGRIGELRLVVGHFSYFRRDPNDIRSRVDWGGGALLDIGCYPITLSRWLFGAEPLEVTGQLEHDPDMGVDRLGSALLRFPSRAGALHLRRAAGAASANADPRHVRPDRGGDSVQRACRPSVPNLRRRRIDSSPARAPRRSSFRPRISMRFRRIGSRMPFAVSARCRCRIEDAIANMAVIDAIFRSAESRRWEAPSAFSNAVYREVHGARRYASLYSNSVLVRATFSVHYRTRLSQSQRAPWLERRAEVRRQPEQDPRTRRRP